MPSVQPVKGGGSGKGDEPSSLSVSLLPTAGSKKAHAHIRYSALRPESATSMLRGRISGCQTGGTNLRVRLSDASAVCGLFLLGLHHAKSISCLYQVHGSGFKRTIRVSPPKETRHMRWAGTPNF